MLSVLGVFPSKLLVALSDQQKKSLETEAVLVSSDTVRFDGYNFVPGDLVTINDMGRIGLLNSDKGELIGVAVSSTDVVIYGKSEIKMRYDVKLR